MRIVREEIFGPVMSVLPFDTGSCEVFGKKPHHFWKWAERRCLNALPIHFEMHLVTLSQPIFLSLSLSHLDHLCLFSLCYCCCLFEGNYFFQKLLYFNHPSVLQNPRWWSAPTTAFTDCLQASSPQTSLEPIASWRLCKLATAGSTTTTSPPSNCRGAGTSSLGWDVRMARLQSNTGLSSSRYTWKWARCFVHILSDRRFFFPFFPRSPLSLGFIMLSWQMVWVWQRRKLKKKEREDNFITECALPSVPYSIEIKNPPRRFFSK